MDKTAIKSKILVIGKKHQVSIFQGIGMDIYEPTNEDDIEKVIKLKVKEGYNIILIQENYIDVNDEWYGNITKKNLPIILLIPDAEGSQDKEFQLTKKLVERAIGIDILGKE